MKMLNQQKEKEQLQKVKDEKEKVAAEKQARFNRAQELENLINQKIDFITTDEPELLLRVLKK